MKRFRLLILLCSILFVLVYLNQIYDFTFATLTTQIWPRESSQHHGRNPGGFQRFCTKSRCLWLHTAYIDPRSSRLVRIIVVGERAWLSVSLFCHFHFGERKQIKSNRSIIIPHMIRHSLKYHGYTVKCRYPVGSTPDGVSLSIFPNQIHGPILPLVRIPERQQQPETISVCLAPLHGMTSEKVDGLIEWFEYYQLLGVSHFVAYNWSVTDASVTRVLNHYIKKGILELVPWRLPVPTDPSGPWPPRKDVLHYFGQMTADTDCMYRLMNRFQWLLFCDLDEYLVPRVSKDLPSLVSSWYRKGDLLLFRSTDFDRSLGLSPIGESGLLALNYSRHLGLNRAHYRSKIIIDPSIRGESMGVHQLFFLCPKSEDRLCYLGNDKFVVIPPKVAVLHHYRFIRDSTERKDFFTGRKVLNDTSMALFADALIHRVKILNIQLTLP